MIIAGDAGKRTDAGCESRGVAKGRLKEPPPGLAGDGGCEMEVALNDFARMPLAELSAALRESRIRAAEVLEYCASRRQEELGAYRAWDQESAARQAHAADVALACGADPGPLCGIPVSVKDIFGVTGFDTFAGSPKPLPEIWTRDGPLVRKLRAQLCAIVGKTHTVEFAFSGLGANPHWGTPLNPYGREALRVPGGSSSGAGISVSEGSALLAVGSDTAGSIRVPASMVGVAGLKTTKGRWSTQGIVPLSRSLDTPGLIARDAHDLAYAFAALEDAPVPQAMPLSDLTIGIPRQLVWEDCDEGIVETVESGLAKLEDKEARRREVDLPEAVEAYSLFRQGGLAAAELGQFLDAELPEWRETLDPNVRSRVDANRDLKAHEYIDRKLRIENLSQSASQRLRDVHVIATPTVAITPPRQVDIKDPKAHTQSNIVALRNTVLANLLGLCGATIPVGTDKAGMPVGLQLLAPAHAEAWLLRAAMAIERALDFACAPSAKQV